jgi:hypothetical protein
MIPQRTAKAQCLYTIKGRWGRLTDEIKWKWRKELEQFAVVFANGHRANFAISRASSAKSKERTRAIQARFLVLKGPIRRQTVRAKQAGHFPLPNTQVTTKTHRCCFATSVSQKRKPINVIINTQQPVKFLLMHPL